MTTLFALLSICISATYAAAGPLPRHGTLGVPLRPVPAELGQKLHLGPQEALQATATSNGLTVNDIVIAVRGKRFKSFAAFAEDMRAETVKPTARLTVNRGGRQMEVDVQVQPRPLDRTDAYETDYQEVTSNGHRIRVLVTKPLGAGRRPVLFYIQGINLGSVDFPLTSKNYIASLLRGFASDFVTVRVEKIGVGDSEGGPARTVGFDEEDDIYRQALKSIAKQDFVDPDKIFVFGHSMGGCHAPLICSGVRVRGIISYGTVANSWLEWEIRSPRVEGPLSGKSSAETDKEIRTIVGFYHYLYTEKRSVDWIKRNRPDLKKYAEEQSPDNLMLGDRSVRYMQEVNDHNFCQAWARLGNTKVLALFGENDWISLKEDQAEVASVVNAAHAGSAEFQIVPESDHIFNKCTSMKDDYDRFGKPGMEFNPAVIDAVKDWICSITSPDNKSGHGA